MSKELSPAPVSPENEPFEYRLLTGHRRTDGSWKTDQQLHMEYIQLTDELVRQMTEGVEIPDLETGRVTVEKPDVVIWLDKSARPVSWLTKELWPKLAADPETGEVAKMPEFKFVNIDREQWVNELDPEGTGIMDIGRIDETIIRGLRSVFVPDAKLKREVGLTESIDSAPSLLDNKTIMIVDEVYGTGRTLEYATAFFRKAFPTAKVGYAHWMRNVSFRDGAKGNADLPVWYKADSQYGRGVGNRNDSLSAKSQSITQKLGRSFLSTALRESDPQSEQLRKEIHELATNPDVPALPSMRRSNEDRLQRYSFYNEGLTRQEVLAEKEAIQSES